VFAISLALGRAHLILLRHLHRSCQLLFADIHIQTISEEILSSSVNAIHGRTSVEARNKKIADGTGACGEHWNDRKALLIMALG